MDLSKISWISKGKIVAYARIVVDCQHQKKDNIMSKLQRGGGSHQLSLWVNYVYSRYNYVQKSRGILPFQPKGNIDSARHKYCYLATLLDNP